MAAVLPGNLGFKVRPFWAGFIAQVLWRRFQVLSVDCPLGLDPGGSLILVRLRHPLGRPINVDSDIAPCAAGFRRSANRDCMHMDMFADF